MRKFARHPLSPLTADGGQAAAYPKPSGGGGPVPLPSPSASSGIPPMALIHEAASALAFYRQLIFPVLCPPTSESCPLKISDWDSVGSRPCKSGWAWPC